jgi:predicted transcriptional regulator
MDVMKVYPVKAVSKRELEERAERLLSRFFPECLQRPTALNVERLIDVHLEEEFGWSLDVRETFPLDILGYTDPKTKTLNISEETHEAIIAGDGRARFTGCHEFSHVVLHGDQMRDRMVSFSASNEHLFRKDRLSLRAFEDPEWQADYLAGALLMPAKMVRELRRQTSSEYQLLEKMCEAFKVSRQAAEVRLKKMI